jgi:protein-S-isoprenylcysteine O-methyltransferase Ste14
MHDLELKVPPLAFVLFIALLMWLVSWTVPQLGFDFPGHVGAALALGAAGAITILLGVASFRRAKTTFNPMKPEASTFLVVSCVYKFSRNPMYLGLLLIVAGWAVFLSNLLAFLLLPAFVFYMSRFQIEPEERALRAKFPEKFAVYEFHVRRWL